MYLEYLYVHPVDAQMSIIRIYMLNALLLLCFVQNPVLCVLTLESSAFCKQQSDM